MIRALRFSLWSQTVSHRRLGAWGELWDPSVGLCLTLLDLGESDPFYSLSHRDLADTSMMGSAGLSLM